MIRQSSNSLLLIISLALMRSCQGITYHIEKEDGIDLTAPEIMCLPGVAYVDDVANSCPINLNEATMHNSIVMDSSGSISVTMKHVRSFKRDRVIRKKVHGQDGRLISESALVQIEIDDERQVNEKKKKNAAFHLQFMLVSVSEVNSVLDGLCCFERFSDEIETQISTSSPKSREEAEDIIKSVRKELPSECSLPDQLFNTDSTLRLVTDFDYKIGMNRISREDDHVSDPITLSDENDPSTMDIGATISFTLQSTSEKSTPHVLMVSNCAAEIDITINVASKITTDVTGKGVTFEIESIDVGHVSKFGELPLSMMGIIPFYGSLVFCYGFLATIWFLRSKDVFMMPLQSSIKNLVYMQLVFCCLAFSYYVHLNRKAVDVEVLYSGTAAALVNWDAWSITVALGHFCTILACQFVVTLAADGTWLIQNNIRRSTRRALTVLCIAWLIFFVLYGFVRPLTRRIYFASCGVIWVAFVLCLVRNSLNHLKSLIMEGHSNESVIAGGGILVAKRSLFRKMFGAIAAYPIVFVASLLWKSMTRHDKWAWVGFILGDFYLLCMLLHASYIWIPKTLSSGEFVKYAPLDLEHTFDDKDVWDGDMEFSSHGFD